MGKRRQFLFLIGAILSFMLVSPHFDAAQAAEEKYLALTFDDGPSGRFTERLLEGLAQRDAKATFFLCGYRLETYGNLAKRIVTEGHEVGLHGYSHNPMDAMTQGKLEKELDDTAALLYDATGEKCYLLRPPGGQSTRSVEKTAADRGLSLIFWSVDPKDWATHDAEAVTRRVVEKAEDGDIILLHDMSDSSVDAALKIVDILKEEGYQFVTVGELADLQGEALAAGSLYYSIPKSTASNDCQ